MDSQISRNSVSLDGPWRYTLDPESTGERRGVHTDQFDRSEWAEMTLPANWYRTQVGDYHGVAWFARSVRADEFDPVNKAAAGARRFIRFGAVDYICDAWLNGVYLGRHEGFFAPFEFEITRHIRRGENWFVVRVDSPFDETEFRRVDRPDLDGRVSEEAGMYWPVDLSVVKGAMIHFYHRPGWETKNAQDGNTGGIWQSVSLIRTGVAKIDRVKIYPKLVKKNGVADGTAIVSADISINYDGQHAAHATVTIEGRGKNFSAPRAFARSVDCVLVPGSNTAKIVCTVEDPALWWSWDLGSPNLYEATVTVATESNVSDCVTETFGIRELVIDEKGQWILNGTRVFARGMRYLSSIWLGDGNEEMFREDLGKMMGFHINSIRIGSHVEKPEFYDICDELGLLVWQVFPLHYAYSDSDDLIERAAPMMAEMVRTFYNHPSIVIWSVFKEPDVYGLDDPPNNYGRLCQIMYEAGRTEDPIRWVHTGDYHEGAQHLMTGITQPGEMDFRKVNLEPQVVEYGSGAMPPIETVHELLDPADRWPPNWDRWFYLNADPRWFVWEGIDVDGASSLEELVEATQTWSARQIKESI